LSPVAKQNFHQKTTSYLLLITRFGLELVGGDADRSVIEEDQHNVNEQLDDTDGNIVSREQTIQMGVRSTLNESAQSIRSK
jgi:hypothetical protein